MARADFNPLDFGDVVPEELSASDTDISQYLPQPLPAERRARRAQAPAVRTASQTLPAEARALLDAIATDESPDYNTIYGGRKFSDYSRHPGAYIPIQKGPHAGEKSSAAGRYQFIERTWNDQAAKLGLKDFSPESQDRAAWNYAQEVYGRQSGRDLLADLRSKDPKVLPGITSALSKVWTSMPGGIEQRSHANKFLNRYAQSLAAQGATPVGEQGPTGETYDIPLSNGQTLTVPKDVDRQEAINSLRAQGMDVEGVTEHELTGNRFLALPDSVNVNDALADLQRQFPDQEWMTKAHAEKTGLAPAFGAAVKGIIPTAQRGVGEIAQEFGLTKALGDQLIKGAEARQAEISKGFEETLPTDPLSKRIAQGAGTVLGGAAGTLPLAGLAMTGGLGAGAAALMGIPMAAGSLGQRYAEQGRDMSLAEPGNLATVAAEAAGNVLPLAAGKAGASLLQNIARGAAAAGAVDVPSVALERAAAGQPVADEKALEEYLLTGAGSVLGGGTAGAIAGRLARAKVPETRELPPVQEGAAPSPVEPAPTGGEALAPTEGPVESVEDIEAQARAGEEFFKQAEAAKAAEAEVPEPVVRGREVPAEAPVEAAPAPIEEAPVAEAAPLSFADLNLKGKNSKVLMRSLNELDLENPEHGKAIGELLNNAENVQHNPEAMQAIRTRLQEVQDASKIQGAEPIDAGRGERPEGGEEVRYPAEGGEGVRISDQEGQRLAGKGKGPEEVGAGEAEAARIDQAAGPELKYAKAEEPKHIDVEGVKRPVTDSTGAPIHTTEEGVKNFWKGFKDTKVVDAEGRPQVVYHGTDKDFNAFEMQRPTKRWTTFSEDNVTSQGAFFSPSPTDAGGYGKRVIASYLNIKNPLVDPSAIAASSRTPEERARAEKARSDAEYILEPLVYEADGRKWIDTDNGISRTEVDPEGSWVSKALQDNQIDWAYLDNPAVVERMKERGYDGVKVYEPNDEAGYSWFVTEPNQVKSATDNKGAFDTTKADIREARGIPPEAAHTPESLDQQIKSTYGKDAPRVDVSTAAAEGVEPNVKGFYDPTKKRVVLIADNIGKGEDIHGLMRHEVAVHARRLGKTDPEFKSILDRLQSLKASGDANVARAYDRVPKDTTPAHIHEEALAYLAQHAPNLPIVKQFTSWMRRTAHKLTGSANWLKADDFGPMADEILRRAEPKAPKAEGRMYSVADAADNAVKNTVTETWFERLYTPIRTQIVSTRAPLEAILGKLPLYDENNKIRATAKIAQQTRHMHLVSEGLHTGYLAKNKQGLVQAVFDPRLSPDQIINRVMELPEAMRDRFSESMVTLAQAGHNLRGAEMKAIMDDAQRKIKLGQSYLDQTKSRYEKEKITLEALEKLANKTKPLAVRSELRKAEQKASENPTLANKAALAATKKRFDEAEMEPRVAADYKRAKARFDAAKAEYRNPNYAAGKDYIATQQRLYRAVSDQFNKARRDEAGRIYDISPEQERAARDFLASTPETKQLAADIRELFAKNAKLLRDTSVISDATYKKFTDSKYDYAPLYMSIEDLDAAMPASAVYLQGGQRTVMPVKGLKGSQHQIRFFENLLSHQARTGAMALHNNARLGSLESLVEMGRAKELPGTTPPKGLDVVAAIKDGKRRFYHVPDRPLYEAFEIVHNVGAPEWITNTTKFASRSMLVNPKYWWNQLVREPFMATFTSRAGVITPFHSGKEFASLLFSELPGVETSASKLYHQLKAQGVSGSHEYLRDLIKEKGKLQASKGLAQNYRDSRDLVMRIHEYADAATKVAVMRKALERAESGKLTGKPLQGEAARDAAITHVGEMINFANRGRNSTVQFITQATPFFNSWAQGMDALIRYATGYGMDPHTKGSTIAGLRAAFVGHAAAMVAFSAAITAIRCELSEDYRNADPEEWSANWLLPIPDTFETKEGRMVKAKGPFELNTLFKLGPEMWVRNWYGLDRDKDYTAALKSSIWRDIAPPGLDQLFMPYLPVLVLETLFGHELSEGTIKPLADTSLAPAERGKGLSPIADTLSGGPLSPAAVKHFGQGVFGGMYDMLDSAAKGAAAAFGSDTARADLRDITEKVPVISGMLTNPDRIELGSAYEFADKQAMVRHTAKALTKRGDREAAAEYKEEGRYAKQAEKIKRKISKTNAAIERLKNTKDYEDADKIQRQYEQQLEKKRKQVGKLEALRSKAEENE